MNRMIPFCISILLVYAFYTRAIALDIKVAEQADIYYNPIDIINTYLSEIPVKNEYESKKQYGDRMQSWLHAPMFTDKSPTSAYRILCHINKDNMSYDAEEGCMTMRFIKETNVVLNDFDSLRYNKIAFKIAFNQKTSQYKIREEVKYDNFNAIQSFAFKISPEKAKSIKEDPGYTMILTGNFVPYVDYYHEETQWLFVVKRIQIQNVNALSDESLDLDLDNKNNYRVFGYFTSEKTQYYFH